MAESLLTALGLVLIIEGLLPFAAPTAWRQTLARLAQAQDVQVRLVALGALIAGMALLLV
jgi:uncharacterized protein YjeT (DUF2065 family)